MLDLKVISEKCAEISNLRIKNKAVEPDIWKACAMEVIEAKEACIEYEHVKNYYGNMPIYVLEELKKDVNYNNFPDDLIEKYKKAYASEIADAIICNLIAGNKAGIDIEQAILDKIKINELRAHKIGDKL